MVPLKQQLNKQSSLPCATNGVGANSGNSIRINKQAIQGSGANSNQHVMNTQQQNGGTQYNGNGAPISTKSTPSLASAYFPSN